jgi:uncharacterized cupredoxin-like copper-binding protein
MRKALVAVFVMTGLALGGSALAGTRATTIRLTEKEFSITPAIVSAKAGRVTFSVHNIGHLTHEFLVIKTPLLAAKLPVKGAKVVVKPTAQVGAILAIAPGKTRRLTLTLRKGHYVLICNLPAHYQAGQRATLNIR